MKNFSLTCMLIVMSFVTACDLAKGKRASSSNAPEDSEQYWVIADDVRLRSEANIGSKVVAVLQSGYNVRLLERTTEKQTIGGRTGSWLKISFRGTDYQEKIGYVFDPFLVPDKQGPPGLEKEANGLASTNPKEAIRIYTRILKEFPNESEIGLFSRRVWVQNRIVTLECWQTKDGAGAESKDALLNLLKIATEKKNRASLLKKFILYFSAVGESLRRRSVARSSNRSSNR